MIVGLNTIAGIAPELILVGMATWIYLCGSFVRGPSQAVWALISLLSYMGAGAALVTTSSVMSQTDPAAAAIGPIAFDQLGNLFRAFALLLGLLFTLVFSRTAGDRLGAEIYGTLMLLVVGLMFVSSANELIVLFLGLELISIPLYVLLFITSEGRAAVEATAKYFFLSILSSSLLLYGMSFLYGLSGTTVLDAMGHTLTVAPTASQTPLATISLVLIMAGLGFKIAAVPFHFYAPDVYQGAGNASAGLLAVMPKIGGMLALIRLLVILLPVMGAFCWQLSIAIAILTMTLGNVCALWQGNIRRLMAYSSIAHAGYMLIGLAAALAFPGSGGLGALFFYLAVYSLASIGTFAAVTFLGGAEHQVSEIDELDGLGRSRPIIAACIAIAMFSLAGIPPLAGFWGKFSLFSSAIATYLSTAGPNEGQLFSIAEARWFLILAIVGAVNAAIAAAYYLRIVSVMYFRPMTPQSTPVPERGGVGVLAATCLSSVLLVAVGAMPGQVAKFAAQSEQAVWNPQRTTQVAPDENMVRAASRDN